MELEEMERKSMLMSNLLDGPPKILLNDADIVTVIAVPDYFNYEVSGYLPGHEIQDWLDI